MSDDGREDWKRNVGFPINYNSTSSDDDINTQEVVFRNPRIHSSKFLLQDSGDGSEADLLGTTPPRSRIRDKEKGRRNHVDSPSYQRLIPKREAEVPPQQDYGPPIPERMRKRSSLKIFRTRARDSKQDMNHEARFDSLPSPNPLTTAVPTLVESCSRFMSLTSRPKSRESPRQPPPSFDVEDRWGGDGGEDLPPSRVSFHKTFSLLINMGNIEKGCKRAISREEQVWQNELKDLIWLELQAKLAGRTLDQQDAYLCAQRKSVPTIIDNILQYKFVNTTPCKFLSKPFQDDDVSKQDIYEEFTGTPTEEDIMYGCVQFECGTCSRAVGGALREVGALLHALHRAHALYPSGRALQHDHPRLATPAFCHRLKALCLWYNTALHLRLKMVAMCRMLRAIRLRTAGQRQTSTVDSDLSRQSSECPRPPVRVRFNVDGSDSANSDSSPQTTQSDVKNDADANDGGGTNNGGDANDTGDITDGNAEAREETTDELDSGGSSNDAKSSACETPDIVIDAEYGRGDPHASSESGYMSSEGAPAVSDAFDIGSITELTHLSLLKKCRVSGYREYHREILKTQGVRRCMMFLDKMRTNLLDKVCLTLEKPEEESLSHILEEEAENQFEEQNEGSQQEFEESEQEMKTYELVRYGYWSEECISMRLPSYRSHFLLLSAICMEVVHDYLSFRLETRPDHPSCITIKQLIHELREGLDISSQMRAQFTRHARAALCARAAGPAARALHTLTRTYDNTMRDILKQYLSYLCTMSKTEHMPRSRLQAEWAFTAQLATRVRCAKQLAPLYFTNITCNQLNRLLKQFENDLSIVMAEEAGPQPDKQQIYAVCRAAQSWYASSRDAALQAALWARALAATLAPLATHLRKRIFDCLMAIRDVIVKHIMYIMERSKSTGDETGRDPGDAVHARVRELLLQIYKLGFEIHKELYKFVHVNRCSDEVRRERPISLQPVRSPMVERRKRPETMVVHESFNLNMLHRFSNEPLFCPPGPRPSLTSPPRRPRVLRADSVVDDHDSVFDDRLLDANDHLGETERAQSSMELILYGELVGSGEEEEEEEEAGAGQACGGECERRWGAGVARAVIQFAHYWMKFATERCDRGRGLRPRWASQGLEFLMLACDPRNTKHLSDEEFEVLKREMDGCISHVVGSRPVAAALSPRPRPRLPSPFPSNSSREAPPTPPADADRDPLSFPDSDGTAHHQRVLDAIKRVDRERDSALRACKSVGRVLEAAVSAYEPKLRQLTFKWQRGLKIGAGTFGKVYTVVNTESGQLLAMKELSVGVGDRRALQRAANELRVLEGVLHPHLVRYYGCELHREEMLIFMELCVEGSLEALVATSGALAEPAVRRYTLQLLSAVRELHARAIAHRDIKSGNIFLTNEGHCLKLGDFGCAVKIRANTTAPGELQGFVGTQAYMAPEVFMKTGHGRAADIWSLGCVVTEMATGKRPFYQYDSNYQIMFLVGSGGRPEIPTTLSEEGQQFCLSCLTHDPDVRPKAETLMMDHFLMVKASDDDCKCEPAFLITNTNSRK